MGAESYASTLSPLSSLWPPVFASEQDVGPPNGWDVGQEVGLEGQTGVLSMSDRLAEMGRLTVNDDGGEQAKPGHTVVLALAGSMANFSLAADTGYSEGSLRELLEKKNIAAYIPIHPRQENSMVARGDFAYHGDHLVCPQGKVLRKKSFHRRSSSFQYLAREQGCQACPIRDTCLPPGHKRRYISLTMYHPVYLRDRERNRTAAYRRERRRRMTVAEGIFASLDRLRWARSRLRGLWKVDCEGYMAAFAHNILKLVRRLASGVSPPAPASPAVAAALSSEPTLIDAVTRCSPQRFNLLPFTRCGSDFTQIFDAITPIRDFLTRPDHGYHCLYYPG